MSTLTQRKAIIELADQTITAGARQVRASQILGKSAGTLQPWQCAPQQGDRRPERVQQSRNWLTQAEHEHILTVVTSLEYAHSTPSQIALALVERPEQVPVAPLAGTDKRGARDDDMDADVVRPGALRVQSDEQVAQPAVTGQLRIARTDEVAPDGKGAHTLVGLVNIHQMVDVAKADEFEQLCRDGSAAAHERVSVAREVANHRIQLQISISSFGFVNRPRTYIRQSFYTW